VLAIALVLVVAARLVLDPLASHFLTQSLSGIEGYRGRFAAVHVSVLPLELQVTDLVFDQEGVKAEPIAAVHDLRAQVLWRKLLQGRVVALATVDKAKVVITVGRSRVTEQLARGVRDANEELRQNDFDFGVTLQKLIPLRIDRIEVREGEFLVVDATDPRFPGFWVSEIELVLDNLVTRPELDQGLPLTLTMRARVAKTGVLKAMATADLHADKPAFTGQAQMTGLRLESLYAWTSSKAGLSAKGNFEVFTNFNSTEGVLSGDVKVLVRNAEVGPANAEVSSAVKASLANLAIKVLSDRVEGREAIGTTMPIRGTLKEVDAQVWPTILGVIRNAFVQGLDWGFSDLPRPTAPDEQGVLPQAVRGLDKQGPGPLAQPATGAP
jgi:hypothetical protein